MASKSSARGSSYGSISHRDKKEIFISETQMSMFRNSKQNHVVQLPKVRANNHNISFKDMASNSTNTNDKANKAKSVQNSPERGRMPQNMIRLRLMKTAVFDAESVTSQQYDVNAQASERSEGSGIFSQHLENRLGRENLAAGIKQDPKWFECKVIGRNIPTRSRAAVAIHKNYMYIYGGYELTAGCMSDFWRINIASDAFAWEKVQVNGRITPGPKSRSSCHVFQDKLYLLCGSSASTKSSSDIWCYDLKTENNWSLITPASGSVCPPAMDSQSSVLIGSSVIVFFGYFTEQAALSNAVYEFNIDTNLWRCLSQKQNHHHIGHSSAFPIPRLESSVCVVPNKPGKVFAFGGCDGFNRLNDVWMFDLKTNQFTEVKTNSTVLPMIRSGHQLVGIQDQIILIGGIHDITWELDDLWVFDLSNQQWKVVDSDTGRSREHAPIISSNDLLKEQDPKKSPSLRSKKRVQTTLPPLSLLKFASSSATTSPVKKPIDKTLSSFTNEEIPNENEELSRTTLSPTLSPTKLAEKRRKEFQAQKANMLSQFEVQIDLNAENSKPNNKNNSNNNSNNNNKIKLISTTISANNLNSYLDFSPTSEAMKNSLQMIGNPMPTLRVRQNRLTDFGRVSVSKFLEPLLDQHSLRQGKRPCARDGHRAVMLGEDKIFIFGGDRHNMSFNDIYQLDLAKLAAVTATNNDNTA